MGGAKESVRSYCIMGSKQPSIQTTVLIVSPAMAQILTTTSQCWLFENNLMTLYLAAPMECSSCLLLHARERCLQCQLESLLPGSKYMDSHEHYK